MSKIFKNMERKKITLIGIVVVLILALIFMVMLISRLKNQDGGAFGNSSLRDNYTEANLEGVVPASDEAVAPAVLSGTGEVIPGTVVPESVDYPEKVETVDFRPTGESVEQPEQIIMIGKLGFEPRKIGAVAGAKVTLTFDAIDENQHKIVFLDESLSYLNFQFAKKDGAMTRIFPAPKAGEYKFYIDNEENFGTFTVINE